MTRPAGSQRRVRASARASGFTLLELIIVVAIFAIFAVMAYGGLNSVLTTRTQLETSQARLAELQRAYIRLRDDLQQLWPRGVRDAYGEQIPALRGLESPLVLEFTRAGWRNPAMLPRATLERVLYRVEEGRLIRSNFRVLDQAQDSKAVDAVLLTGVDELQLRYLDAERQWRPRWPMESADRAAAALPPPLAVEIVLQTRQEGRLRFLFKAGADRINIPAAAAGGTPTPPANGGGNGAPAPDPELQ